MRERRLFALHLYLLLCCVARSAPWDTALPAATWARALDKTNKGAEGTVSRSWAWLEEQDLVRTERSKRMVRVYRLAEDGSGTDYKQSRDFFYLPLAFFRDEWNSELSLPATAVLLIALHKSKHKPWFQLRTEDQSKWYGMSPDTLQRGLDELRDKRLLHAHPRRVRESKARYGTTLVNEYILLGAFATPGSEAPAGEPAAS